MTHVDNQDTNQEKIKFFVNNLLFPDDFLTSLMLLSEIGLFLRGLGRNFDGTFSSRVCSITAILLGPIIARASAWIIKTMNAIIIIKKLFFCILNSCDQKVDYKGKIHKYQMINKNNIL